MFFLFFLFSWLLSRGGGGSGRCRPRAEVCLGGGGTPLVVSGQGALCMFPLFSSSAALAFSFFSFFCYVIYSFFTFFLFFLFCWLLSRGEGGSGRCRPLAEVRWGVVLPWSSRVRVLRLLFSSFFLVCRLGVFLFLVFAV